MTNGIQRTDLKNEAHSILAPEMFNLNDVLTDIFGKNGRSILSGITSGKTVDEIIENLVSSSNCMVKSKFFMHDKYYRF